MNESMNCWFGYLTHRIIPKMIYNILRWTLNPDISCSLEVYPQPWSLSTIMLLWHPFGQWKFSSTVWSQIHLGRLVRWCHLAGGRLMAACRACEWSCTGHCGQTKAAFTPYPSL